MFLFWIGFYYLVLFEVWLCERVLFFVLLVSLLCVVFVVEEMCLSFPSRSSGAIVIFSVIEFSVVFLMWVKFFSVVFVYNFSKGLKLKKTIEAIVVTLFRKAFPYTLRASISVSKEDGFESLGLSHTDILFFIDDFILKEEVPFFTEAHPNFIGESIDDMVNYIHDCFMSANGNGLSGKVFFSLLLYDIQTKKRKQCGMAF